MSTEIKDPAGGPLAPSPQLLQRAVEAMAQCTCALVDLIAMVEDNARARSRGQDAPYRGRDMTGLVQQHGVSWGAIRQQLSGAPAPTPAEEPDDDEC